MSKAMPWTEVQTPIDRPLSKALPVDAPLVDGQPNNAADGGAYPLAPVDVAVLRKLIGDDPTCVTEFLHAFRSSAACIALEAERAYAAGDADKTMAAVHKLKSAARAVGAMGLGDVCVDMERAGSAGRLDVLGLAFEHFKLEMAAVDAHLAMLLSGNTQKAKA